MTIDTDNPGDGDQLQRELREVFAAVPEAITRARHLLVRWLRAWGHAELVSPLELAIGELFTNAVRHGVGPIELSLAALPDRVRVEVHDHGGGTPAIRTVQTTGTAIGGWGLRLVDQLVDAWGTHVTTDHTTVWVEQATSLQPSSTESSTKVWPSSER